MLLHFKMGVILSMMFGLSVNVAFAEHNEFNNTHNLNSPESLYGIQMGEESVTIQVKSNGCTRREHFEIKINEIATAENGIRELTVVRLGRDRCRRMPFLLSVNLSMPDLKGPFKLINPLMVWRITKRQ